MTLDPERAAEAVRDDADSTKPSSGMKLVVAGALAPVLLLTLVAGTMLARQPTKPEIARAASGSEVARVAGGPEMDCQSSRDAWRLMCRDAVKEVSTPSDASASSMADEPSKTGAIGQKARRRSATPKTESAEASVSVTPPALDRAEAEPARGNPPGVASAPQAAASPTLEQPATGPSPAPEGAGEPAKPEELRVAEAAKPPSRVRPQSDRRETAELDAAPVEARERAPREALPLAADALPGQGGKLEGSEPLRQIARAPEASQYAAGSPGVARVDSAKPAEAVPDNEGPGAASLTDKEVAVEAPKAADAAAATPLAERAQTSQAAASESVGKASVPLARAPSAETRDAETREAETRDVVKARTAKTRPGSRSQSQVAAIDRPAAAVERRAAEAVADERPIRAEANRRAKSRLAREERRARAMAAREVEEASRTAKRRVRPGAAREQTVAAARAPERREWRSERPAGRRFAQEVPYAPYGGVRVTSFRTVEYPDGRRVMVQVRPPPDVVRGFLAHHQAHAARLLAMQGGFLGFGWR